MALITACELEAMFKDAGGPLVEYNGQETYGRKRIMDDVVVGDDGFAEVVGAAETLTIATGRLTDLARDIAIIIGGVDYEIRDHRRIDDGTLTRIWLRSA